MCIKNLLTELRKRGAGGSSGGGPGAGRGGGGSSGNLISLVLMKVSN